jgi:hypothetical protein
MAYDYVISTNLGLTIWSAVIALDKDHGDRYWMVVTLLPEAWSKMWEVRKCGYDIYNIGRETYEV